MNKLQPVILMLRIFIKTIIKPNFRTNKTRTMNLPEGQCTSIRSINNEFGFFETVFIGWPSEVHCVNTGACLQPLA